METVRWLSVDWKLPYIWLSGMVYLVNAGYYPMKTTLNLDDQLIRKAKKRAMRDGISLARFVEDALRAKLLLVSRHGSKYKFRPVVVEGTREPNVDISNRDALYDIVYNG